MTMRKFLPKLVSLLGVLSMAAPQMAVAATTYTYYQDTTLTVAGQNLKIMAGSQRQTLTTNATSFTVTLGAGEVFIVRASDPVSILENDVLEPTCNVISTIENQLVLNGPKTATVTPTAFTCSTAGAGDKPTPLLTLSQPNGGETYEEGKTYQMFWQTAGTGIASVRLQYSTDGGATWQTVVDNLINNGFYAWTVPQVADGAARFRIDGMSEGRIVAFDLAAADSALDGTVAPPAPEQQPGGSLVVEPYDYEPAEEMRTAATIGIDKGLAAAPQSQLICHPDSRIKVKGLDTVYYCGADGKRYVFPNRKTHDSWYGSFAGVIELDLADVQRIPLGGNVTYRPGARMIKIQTANEVFAIAPNGTLRHVVTEAAAARLYGPNWNQMIDDLPDAFVTNYKVGEPILE